MATLVDSIKVNAVAVAVFVVEAVAVPVLVRVSEAVRVGDDVLVRVANPRVRSRVAVSLSLASATAVAVNTARWVAVAWLRTLCVWVCAALTVRMMGTGVALAVVVADAVRVRDGAPPMRSAVAVRRSLSTNCVALSAMAVRTKLKLCIVWVAPTINVHTGCAIVGTGVRVRVGVRDKATTVCVCPISGVMG